MTPQIGQLWSPYPPMLGVNIEGDAGSLSQNQGKTRAQISHRDHHYTLLVPNLATALVKVKRNDMLIRARSIDHRW